MPGVPITFAGRVIELFMGSFLLLGYWTWHWHSLVALYLRHERCMYVFYHICSVGSSGRAVQSAIVEMGQNAVALRVSGMLCVISWLGILGRVRAG